MRVGVPKEIKIQEYRVGMVPAGVRALVDHGHQVFVERGAGLGSGIADDEYVKMGATILDTADEVWSVADMVVKVKEPIAPEYTRMKPRQVVYTYFHLAAAPELATVLLEREIASVAYETVQLDNGKLPMLEPMSEVAGRMAVQQGAVCLEKQKGGRGVLLGGVPGVRPGKVTVIGAGTVGLNAAKMAVGLGARVYILDVNLDRLRYIDDVFGNRLVTMYSNVTNIADCVHDADLVVGAVLLAGARAPHLVTEEMVASMPPGAVIVDVAVDQGGCVATCHPTTHENPTYVVHDVIHYCVANMPGAVARTSTFALTNTTIGGAVKLADMGLEAALAADRPLARGINTYKGKCVHKAVAESLGHDYVPFDTLAR
jgi:alanine dehydrogenase